jgi:hypothetical protein
MQHVLRLFAVDVDFAFRTSIFRAKHSKKKMPFHHVGIYVTDLQRSKEFYINALKPLGYKIMMESPGIEGLLFISLHFLMVPFHSRIRRDIPGVLDSPIKARRKTTKVSLNSRMNST